MLMSENELLAILPLPEFFIAYPAVGEFGDLGLLFL